MEYTFGLYTSVGYMRRSQKAAVVIRESLDASIAAGGAWSDAYQDLESKGILKKYRSLGAYDTAARESMYGYYEKMTDKKKLVESDLKRFRVTIPYIHEFYVDAKDPTEAQNKAISEGDGRIIHRDDTGIEIKEEE